MSVTRSAAATVPQPVPFTTTAPTRASLAVGDIPGAIPRSRISSSGRAIFHDPADVAGARPRPLHVVATGHHDVLAVDDIEGARARAIELHTRRCVNPLEPVYRLPSAPEVVAPLLPHKRDLWLVDDIPGTKAPPHGMAALGDKMKPRDTHALVTDDVPGARPRPRVRIATGHHDILDVADITAASTGPGKLRTTRETDPQSPSYRIHGMEIVDTEHHPPAPPAGRAGPVASLHTLDIDGAQPLDLASRRVGGIRMRDRRTFATTNALDDITGAHASTLRRGVATDRRTDPNERFYPLLDGRAWEPDEITLGHSWYVGAAKIAERQAAAAAAGSVAAAAGGDDTSAAPATLESKGATAPATAAGAGGGGGGLLGKLLREPGVSSTPGTAYAMKLVDVREMEAAKLRAEIELWRRTALATSRGGSRPPSVHAASVAAPAPAASAPLVEPTPTPVPKSAAGADGKDAVAAPPLASLTSRAPTITAGSLVVSSLPMTATAIAAGDQSASTAAAPALSQAALRGGAARSTPRGAAAPAAPSGGASAATVAAAPPALGATGGSTTSGGSPKRGSEFSRFAGTFKRQAHAETGAIGMPRGAGVGGDQFRMRQEARVRHDDISSVRGLPV